MPDWETGSGGWMFAVMRNPLLGDEWGYRRSRNRRWAAPSIGDRPHSGGNADVAMRPWGCPPPGKGWAAHRFDSSNPAEGIVSHVLDGNLPKWASE
ncbi:hypothetical protein GCM10012285_52030 [Streptomyces kronopolitis]|uniref:Uncharacterized protein n=1 Tax=Streptomyces kronopolitis TaxID=1612435 RepID=A0ABQ2JTL7_9ACTN|nr:hypothetical protein GCM10012285_52030 [Streptomyces kronopolitis]